MVLTLDQQGGEVVDVEVAHHVGLVFDVDPDEERVRVARGQFLERGAVAAAGAAPQRAQAGHGPARAGQGCRDVGAVIGREGQAVHARISWWTDGRGAPDARILPRPAASVLRMHALVYRCFLMQSPFLVDNADNCALITLVQSVFLPCPVSALPPSFIFIMELASLC